MKTPLIKYNLLSSFGKHVGQRLRYQFYKKLLIALLERFSASHQM